MANADPNIAQLEAVIHRVFTNKLYAAEGLQMDGLQPGGTVGNVYVQGQLIKIEKNTNIAVLGDSIMASIMCEKWFNHRDTQGNRLTKGDWNTLRQLLNNTNLARVGFAHGIDALILRNPGCPSASNEMVATTVEAICGAAYSDAVDAGEDGYDVVRGIMERLGLFNTPLLV